MAIRTVQIRIEGRVQGVGFRAFVEMNAIELELRGWVRNRRDGAVEAVFQGPDAGGGCCRSFRALSPSRPWAAPTGIHRDTAALAGCCGRGRWPARGRRGFAGPACAAARRAARLDPIEALRHE